LITCRKVDWGTAPNILMGSAVMVFALQQMHWQFDLVKVVTFLATFVCGTAMAYSFMLFLTSLSVWMVRNQGLMEMWWLFSSLARYPKEIFIGRWAEPIGAFFTYIVPVLLVVYVPSSAMVRIVEPRLAIFIVVVTAILLWLSRRFFLHALRSYRSASS
jgi:ABC-2 type transport system permease protein